MSKALTMLAKISGLPVEHFFFKRKTYFEDNDKKLKKIKGPAIIISNHKSVYDYPLMIYTFFGRNLRTLVGETVYERNKFLKFLLKTTGCIKVDRNSYNFDFMSKMSECLQKGQVGLIFPESRLHTEKDKNDLLDFAPSYVYLALSNNVPIIPVYTNGIYGKLKKQNNDRARVVVGKWIYPKTLIDKNKNEKENIKYINDYVRNYIIQLGNILNKK